MQSFGCNSVTLMNTNFVIIRKTAWAPCVIAMLKQTTSHFFLRCQSFANKRQKLRDDIYLIDDSIKNLNEESLIDVLLYSSDRLNYSKKCFSIQSVIFKLPNVFKDLLLTSANFVQLLPLRFSLICLLRLYLQYNLLLS